MPCGNIVLTLDTIVDRDPSSANEWHVLLNAQFVPFIVPFYGPALLWKEKHALQTDVPAQCMGEVFSSYVRGHTKFRTSVAPKFR